MKTSIHFLVAGLLAAACGEAAVASGVDLTDDRPQEIQAVVAHSHRALCPDTDGAQLHCFAKIRVDDRGEIVATDSVLEADTARSGLTPADLKSAYQLPTSGGDDMTVAIVDAKDDPDAESDLATYRARFGLPPCTSSNGCFQKVNQRGQTGSYPAADPAWAGEIALDIDMVSAVCPNCKILLVEADSASLQDLGAALNTAVRLGADVVSNSYGGAESASSANADSLYFNHPGVAITAAAGDTGYGVNYPASSRYVTAVGGTTLAQSAAAHGRGWVESVWGSGNHGTGSGCSAHSAKPDFQKDPSCNKRMVADVAAVADPSSGVAVYDRYGSGGWVVAGGTSAASPIVAATLALTGHARDSLGYSYFHPDQFFDVTTGRNGACATGYFCRGAAGYDGPTGNGTPNGTAMARQATGGSAGTSGGLSGTALTRDVPVQGLAGRAGSHRFFTMSVPPDGSAVQFTISGGSGNANLYVRLNSMVGGTHYDCRSTGGGNAESCRFSTGGEYSIELIGNTAYSGVTLTGTFMSQSSVMACRTCQTSAQCIYGEHCIQDGSSTGPYFCAQDCADEPCADGFSCDQTNESGWACRPDMGTCR